MIIQSIRLKNIKSYGEGPNGDGVTVSFENGVNRVAGRNGHGKTTLIESVGYALFWTEPQYEENFQTEAYFLSHGAKEGEIDVTFSCDGQSYRIERTVGRQSGRRSKVIDLSDQSICAEGDKEVSEFLCRLLKFQDEGHLSEIFCKLVGVKQGRLTWPFDSKPSEAKKYFEPLMEVAVFRDCFDRLRGAVDNFEGQKNEHLQKRATIDERIRDRADSRAKLTSAKQKVEGTALNLEAADRERDAALIIKDKVEALNEAVAAARNTQVSKTERNNHAKERCETVEGQVAESKAAVKILADNKPAHTAHTEAVQVLGQLEQQRVKRDGLKQQREDTASVVKDHKAKSNAAREQSLVFGRQRNGKQSECDALAGQVTPLKKKLESTNSAFQKSAEDVENATNHRDAISAWIEGLDDLVNAQNRIAETVSRLSKTISGWDASKLKAAMTTEEETSSELKSFQKKLTKAEQTHTTLEEQLKEISGGMCPFLKEKCRQFDPAKVQTDLEKQFSAITNLKRGVQKADATHQKAKKAHDELKLAQGNITGQESELIDSINGYSMGLEALASDEVAEALKWLGTWERKLPALPAPPEIPSAKLNPTAVASLQRQLKTFVEEAEAWWEKANVAIKSRLKSFNDEERDRNVLEANLKKDSLKLTGLKAEVVQFANKATAKEAEAKQHDGKANNLTSQLGKLDEALKQFVNLDADLKREQQKLDANRIGYERYLGAKKLAEELVSRQTRLTQLQAEAAAAQQALLAATAALKKAEQDFDPAQLKSAREEHQRKHDRATKLNVTLEAEKLNLKNEEKRFKEWEEACLKRDGVVVDIGRCEAAMELTELARKTLRDTAPAVAQHLCTRIAKRAQGVFNQINPDPIELAWDAERYSLHVTPGERRFAMLSGGEQTKLALSMTLAMIEEFSGLGFCIFDEPTYGVDSDSRHKLADAILQAQEAAGLDQLLLVSHDDAFEGKIEHAVLLEKSATNGTCVSVTQ